MQLKRKAPTVRHRKSQTKYCMKASRRRINQYNSYISKTTHHRPTISHPHSMTAETLLDTSGRAPEVVETTKATIEQIVLLRTDRDQPRWRWLMDLPSLSSTILTTIIVVAIVIDEAVITTTITITVAVIIIAAVVAVAQRQPMPPEPPPVRRTR